MFYSWLTTASSHDARWRKTKVFIILTRHNQLSHSWTETLNLVSKIVSEKFASSNWDDNENPLDQAFQTISEWAGQKF